MNILKLVFVLIAFTASIKIENQDNRKLYFGELVQSVGQNQQQAYQKQFNERKNLFNNQTLNEINQTQSGKRPKVQMFETCTSAIQRLKNGPEDFVPIIQKGKQYIDLFFGDRQMLYWPIWDPAPTIANYELQMLFGQMKIERVSVMYPDAKLWGNTLSWTDAIQGQAGNCYLLASLSALAEFPNNIKNLFLTDSKNSAGIYAVRFFIRGKPWVITVDDYIPFVKNQTDGKFYPMNAKLGDNNDFWAIILEKAWAKMKGNYLHTYSGFTENGLSNLLGYPVFSYSNVYQTDSMAIWNYLNQTDSYKFIMGAGTSGGADTTYNFCGIPNSHAYSMISVFTLLNSTKAVQHYMYMFRNPWGTDKLMYNMSWNKNDPKWTADYISQVPYQINPLTSGDSEGIFFMEQSDFIKCFTDFQVSMDLSAYGYSDDWYDVEGDWGFQRILKTTIPQKLGDLYISVITYDSNTVPQQCLFNKLYPIIQLQIFKNDPNGTPLITAYYLQAFNLPQYIQESEYNAGDTFYFNIQYNWSFFKPGNDYTFKIYSQQNLTITDAQGLTNMIHMDGQVPSGFVISKYRSGTQSWNPPWQPKSLLDIYKTSSSILQFVNLVIQNPWTLLWWYDPIWYNQ